MIDQKQKIVVYTSRVGGLGEPRQDIVCFTGNNGFKESRKASRIRMYKFLAYRFSTIQEFDLIYKIENGVMIMHGSAKETLN